MSGWLLLQYVVVALAALASVLVVMHKRFPRTTRRLRIALALPLLREGRPAWMRAIGRRLAPTSMATGKDCGGCDSCG